MTRQPSAAAWSEGGRLGRGARVALLALVVAATGLYLAGWFFLWKAHLPAQQASPLTVWRYWTHWGHVPAVRQALLLCTLVGLGVATTAAAVALWPRQPPLHGDARFATRREIARAGLLGDSGLILGRYRSWLGDRYLMLAGQQGVELVAPPRSGKGAGFVIPNLLNWPGSVIVNDIKGENWTRTAGYRAAHGQQVYLFDPLAPDARTARWNPLAYVAEAPLYRTIDDLHRIAGMLYPDPPGTDPFWSTSARSLFLGIALYLFETPGATRTLGEILRQGMASDAEGFQKHWRHLIAACAQAGYPLSMQTVQLLSDITDLAAVTASSIRKTFTSRLDLWLNPMVDAATAGNDFDLRQLRRQPISLYCRINPDNISRLQPLLNLFFQQAIGLQTQELPEDHPDLKLQLLLMMDEFKSLGRLPVIADSTAFLPGYNVRTAIIVQADSQIVEAYGVEGARSLRKMLAARIVFPPRDFDDAEAISKELGTYTVKQKTRSHRLFEGRAGSVSVSEQARRLLLPQEVKELGEQRLLLFYEGLRPVLAHRIWYFRDRLFQRRLQSAPTVAAVQFVVAPPATPLPPDAAPSLPREKASRESALAALDKLSLADFSLDFDHIEIPTGRPLTDAELAHAVDQFLNTLSH